MRTFSETIIQGRLDHRVDELEMSIRLSGEIFETLPIGLGDTTIDREVLPDGTRGQVRICTQESQGLLGSMVSYNRYLLKEGRIVTDSAYGEVEQQATLIRRVKILAKIAFGKVDHWDRESDFYGNYEEEK